MILSDLSVKQPVFATMMMIALVVLGIFSYRELSIDLFPNIDFPVVTVQTLYPGVAPETVETEVTKRIEEAVNPIEGVKHISSTTTEGVSIVVAEFELGTDIHTAAQDVRSKVSALRRDFPTGVEEPVIERSGSGRSPDCLAFRSLSATLAQRADIAYGEGDPQAPGEYRGSGFSQNRRRTAARDSGLPGSGAHESLQPYGSGSGPRAKAGKYRRPCR